MSDTVTTLGQSAFDFLLEEAVRVALADSEFDYLFHIGPEWVFQALPEFYLDGWEDLSDDQQDDVVEELKEKIRDSFAADY